jgi:hypothetical protein
MRISKEVLNSRKEVKREKGENALTIGLHQFSRSLLWHERNGGLRYRCGKVATGKEAFTVRCGKEVFDKVRMKSVFVLDTNDVLADARRS